MTINGVIQIALYFLVLVLLVKPLGSYMARVYEGKTVGLDRVFGPLERGIYRVSGIRPTQEMNWKIYALAMLLFNLAGLMTLYILQRVQGVLPLNPAQQGPVSPDSSFNTAISFVTNTNWQGYAGESTMSYLTQMLGMTVHNFISAATGMAILVALMRGISRRQTNTIGNFWVDLTRTILYILLPGAFVIALVLVSQGMIQTLAPYQTVSLIQPFTAADGSKITDQVIALGPVASQAAIKHWGTNGGGFFNANAAHPFENPTDITNFILMLAETAIPAALTYTFGRMVGDKRQGWAILAAMLVVLVTFTFITYGSEANGNPRLDALGTTHATTDMQPGGNMEGKEVRFGIANSALFATITTATSTGAVNSMHDSFTPLGGMVPLVMMHFGEVILGGVGSGLYSMLMFAIVAVFIAGLMVGRTPEYLGKKIEAYEMKMASLSILVMPMIVLVGAAIAVVTDAGKAGIANPGPHGFTEILYAFTSAGNNNGSAFAGLSANTPFYNTTLGVVMAFGRYWEAIPILAIAGSLGGKKLVPVSQGTLPTHTPLFVSLLVGVVVIVGALTFIPALALGPVVEHLQLFAQISASK